MELIDLDDDCLIHLFNKLQFHDLLNVAQTSSRNKELVKFVFPKICFRLNDVRQLYDVYSEVEVNGIMKKIRNLSINLRTDDMYLVQFFNKISQICIEPQVLTISDGDLDGFGDGIIQLCQHVTDLHLLSVEVKNDFMKDILAKNNGNLKVLSIKYCDFYGNTMFLEDLRKLEKISFLSSNNCFELANVMKFLDNNCDSLDYLKIYTKPSILNKEVVHKIVSKLINLKTIRIEYNDFDCCGNDILPFARIPTLKNVDVKFKTKDHKVINTFIEELAKTNTVEYLKLSLVFDHQIELPSTIPMNSLKNFALHNVSLNKWTNKFPELEELWFGYTGFVININAIKYLLQSSPKLKILHLTYVVLDIKQCLVVEQFLAQQNRKLTFYTKEKVFNEVMANDAGNFKYLRVHKAPQWTCCPLQRYFWYK